MDYIADEYRNLSPLQIRIATHARYTVPARDIDLDVITAAGILPHHDLLDVGSGTGSFLERLRSGKHTGRLCALDASAAAVEAAGRIEGVESVLGDASSPPFADAEFDVVTARHMLYHVASPIAAIRAAGRVLRPGGTFAATVNRADATAQIFEVVDAAVRRNGVEPSAAPNSIVNSDSLPGLLTEVFGNVEVLVADTDLVVPEPEPVIAYCVSMLTLRGVPEDGPVREAVAADITAEVRRRFDGGGGVWRDPKGYVVCTAVLS
jgi:SAM-dependent methyltransferase